MCLAGLGGLCASLAWGGSRVRSLCTILPVFIMYLLFPDAVFLSDSSARRALSFSLSFGVKSVVINTFLILSGLFLFPSLVQSHDSCLLLFVTCLHHQQSWSGSFLAQPHCTCYIHRHPQVLLEDRVHLISVMLLPFLAFVRYVRCSHVCFDLVLPIGLKCLVVCALC